MIEIKQKTIHKVLKGLILVALAALTLWLTRTYSTDDVHEMILTAGPKARSLYVFLWIVLPIGFFPVPFIAFVGGMAFGFWEGVFLTLIGAGINLSLMFFLSRYLLRETVQAYLYRKYPKSKEILSAEKSRLKFVLVIARLMPLIPYNVENYAFGLTDISYWDYFWISMLFLLPGTFIYINVGDKALDPNQPAFYIAMFLLFLLVFGTAVLGKYLRKPEDSNENSH